MTSYMKDNFETFGYYFSIDVMRSSVCNAKKICYIAPVIRDEIGKINVVCEGFVISENHDVYTFILEELFKISTSRTKGNIYSIFSDEFLA